MENGKVLKSLFPLDTGISDYHDFIFMKELSWHNKWGPVSRWGGGVHVIHNFWYLGKGNEGDKI